MSDRVKLETKEIPEVLIGQIMNAAKSGGYLNLAHSFIVELPEDEIQPIQPMKNLNQIPKYFVVENYYGYAIFELNENRGLEYELVPKDE